MYSSEDLEIKCKANTNKLAYIVEVKPLLLKGKPQIQRKVG